MKYFPIYLSLIILTLACQAQETAPETNKIVGGPCEGCEAIFEYGSQKLRALDTLPGFQENEPKLKVTGQVFERDGRTPAKDVILYVYHTNRQGVYPTVGDEDGWARRHGYIRAWLKTDNQGRYTFYTFRPAAYPNRRIPEHIHVTVKEPNRNAYYIEDFFFEGDPFLTSREKNRLNNRGGNGIVKPIPVGDLFLVERDIILGLNIPDYY